MKKKILLCVTALIFILTIPAAAIEKRAADVIPSLYFEGTQAVCDVMVSGDYVTDTISVDIDLWEGNTCIKSWSDSGQGYVNSVRKVKAKRGKTYTLKVYATVKGVELPMAFITNTCK